MKPVVAITSARVCTQIWRRSPVTRLVLRLVVVTLMVEGVMSTVTPNEPLMMDNTLHFANKRMGLAKVVRMLVNVFGIEWQDTSGQANGHYTRIKWSSDSGTPLSTE